MTHIDRFYLACLIAGGGSARADGWWAFILTGVAWLATAWTVQMLIDKSEATEKAEYTRPIR